MGRSSTKLACVTALLAALGVSACGNDDSAPAPAGGGGATSCPSGHVEAPSGDCMPVGIQGCAEMFIEDDGLCHPSIDKCEPGTIPKFSDGCVPVGILDCAPEFIEGDGLCYPSPDKCAAGTFPVPSEGCVSIDGEQGCGSGSWGNIIPRPDTIWVDLSYAGGDGDGTQQKPVTTIAAALALVVPSGRIALAAGDYAEPVTLGFPVEIVGRCASMVSISGTQLTTHTSLPVIVFLDGALDVRLSGVRLTGSGIGFFAVGGAAALSQVHIHQATAFGALTASSTLTIERSLVEDTLPEPARRTFGRGVEVQHMSELAVHASALIANREAALHALHGGTTMTVSESLVANTLPRESDLFYGRGVDVEQGASLTLNASALLENREVAVILGHVGTAVTVSESMLARTLPQESDLALGRGIVVMEGASLTLGTSALVENHNVALAAFDAGTTVAVSESLLARTLPQQSDLNFGRAVTVQNGASLSLAASTLVDNHEAGILVLSDLPSSATVTESVVERTLARESDGAYGIGLACTGSNTELRIVSSVVRQSRTAAVMLGTQATAEVVGSLIDEVLPGKFHVYEGAAGMQRITATYDNVGDGLVVAFDSNASVNATLVRRASRAGILFASSDGALTGVVSIESRFGLVLQGEPQPNWQHESNRFEGSEQPIVSDGNLPIPQAPPLPDG